VVGAGCADLKGVAIILFDFFGTLVDYSPSRTEQGYERTHALLRELGIDLDYTDFLWHWSETAAGFDSASEVDDHEFSMVELGRAFLTDLGHPDPERDAERLVTSYVSDWSQGVHPIERVPALVERLARHHRLAIVTNTHDPRLVPDHLDSMDIAGHFEAVVTSVEVGWRKPHLAIYAAVLDALGATAAQCTFVGDTKGPDYDGPRAAGMRALLIDPDGAHAIPPADRLDTILDLADRI